MSICSYCAKEGRLAARGLCPICYARYRRNGTAEPIKRSEAVDKCSYCETQEGPFIKKLCRACYQQKYKTGSPERTRVRHLCEQPGCDEHVHSKGFCQRHNMRIRRTGTPNDREDGRGSRGKHPLYERWRSLRRAAQGQLDGRWEDFWNFVADVGECPSKSRRLVRLSAAEPYGPSNMEWREVVGHYSPADRESHNAYRREYSRQRPSARKRGYLKRFYGVTLEWYEERLRQQGGMCAICGNPETNRHHLTGEAMLLAVDHNKVTGAVRALLCAGCNTGMGGLKHDPTLLRKAAAYLEAHALTAAPD